MSSNPTNARLRPETLAAQALGIIDAETGAVVPALHMATTFIRDPDNQYRKGYSYGRADNPNVRQVEAVLAALEGGKTGVLLGSGMSAATAAFLALERPSHILAPQVMYWGLRKWLLEDAPGYGITTTFVDMSDLAAVARAIRPGSTRMLWLETPSNPMWGIADIAGAAAIAHKAGALVGVDSTVATPVLSNPLRLGADVVMHSATKYLNGHSDVIAGALVLAKADAYLDRVLRVRSMLGLILGPFEASLLLRGLRTVHVRVRHQSATALTLARALQRHARIAEVLYPGLEQHPGHTIAARQMTGGFGGMLSIRVKGGEAAAIATAARVEVWKRATSLGGVESLLEHRASVEGAGTPCPADLLRLSAGLESVEDLLADLDQALEASARV